ncbi:unnamed protein product [Cochlearia groenlandica]
MDIPFVAKLTWINGELDGSYGYTFDLESHQRMVLLPNERWTSFRYRDTVYFQPNRLQNAVEAPLVPIRGTHKPAIPIGPPQQRFDNLHYTTCVSQRYRPGKMAMSSKSGPLQDIYVEMKNMMRWNKFQDRTIGKLVKELKSLKKKLAKVANCASCSASQNTPSDVREPEEEASSQVESHRLRCQHHVQGKR